MKDTLMYKITALQLNISFLLTKEGSNKHLDKIYSCYDDIVTCLNVEYSSKIENILDVIYEEVFKLDYRTNIYHGVIKDNVLRLEKHIRKYLNI